MQYREMPLAGDKLSTLGFGCMRFPSNGTRVNEEEAIRQIRYAIDKGINYLDTAWPYHNGMSEIILGKALKGKYREKVKIADKLPHWMCKTREDMDYYLNEQLKRLSVEKIDYYLIHMLDGQSWEKNKKNGILDFIKEAIQSGKITNIGFSFHGARDDFKAIIDDYNWQFCQIQYNILDENAQAGREGLEYAWNKQIGVIVMEPLRGGVLANKLPPAVEKIYRDSDNNRSNVNWALSWILNHPGIVTVLSGMNTQEQIDENITISSAIEVNSMNKNELTTVKNAAEKFRILMKIPCTACQYCMPCPKGVNIPQAFAFYNNRYMFKDKMMNQAFYLLQLDDIQEGRKKSLASQCVGCGLCMKHCPQKIEIPTELKKVEKEFEGFSSKIIRVIAKMTMTSGRRK